MNGAGLLNAVFAQPDTKLVTIKASNAFIHSHANLFSLPAPDYAVVFGECDKLDDRWPRHGWAIDIPRTVAQIRIHPASIAWRV